MAIATGRYLGYGIFDKMDFVNKMRTGMTFEDFVEEDRKTVIRIPTRHGRGGKNRYVPYEFEVDGKLYYGTTKLAYSWDIRNGMQGKTCQIAYEPADPFVNSVSKSDKVQTGLNNSLMAFILALASFLTGALIVPPVVLSIISFVFLGKSKKVNEGSKAMSIAALVLSILGIVSSFICLIIYIGLIVYYNM